MKRILSLLFLCLFLPAVALADEPFTFRNGYTWGMAQSDAEALAHDDGLYIDISNDPGILTYENVPAGDFTAATFQLVFKNSETGDITYHGTLSGIIYTFPSIQKDSNEAAAQLQSLVEALRNTYGEPADSSNISYKWKLPDTTIVLMRSFDTAYTDDTMIYYSITYRPSHNVIVRNGL